MILQKSVFRKSHSIVIDFGANLFPFSFPNSTKITSKPDLEMHRFFDRFWHRFFIDLGLILEANLVPCWPHFPPKWGARWEGPLFLAGFLLSFDFLAPPGAIWAPLFFFLLVVSFPSVIHNDQVSNPVVNLNQISGFACLTGIEIDT